MMNKEKQEYGNFSRWSYNAPIRLPFRILGGIISLLFLSWGILAIVSGLAFDSVGWRTVIPPLGFGLLFGVAAIKGRVPEWLIKDKK
ncbi:MAG: hypothetical protein WA081_05265 [Desulfosalsimonadaceae bacterium]